MRCLFTDKMECKRPRGWLGCCEICSVPASFGTFFTEKKGKVVAEQRFILDRERNRLLVQIAREIADLHKRWGEIEKIPSRAEYEEANERQIHRQHEEA